jgi:hypothetical protein
MEVYDFRINAIFNFYARVIFDNPEALECGKCELYKIHNHLHSSCFSSNHCMENFGSLGAFEIFQPKEI